MTANDEQLRVKLRSPVSFESPLKVCDSSSTIKQQHSLRSFGSYWCTGNVLNAEGCSSGSGFLQRKGGRVGRGGHA